MAQQYATASLFITNATAPVTLDRATWYYPGCEAEGLYAQLVVEFGSIIFRTDGGDPYTSHCQYGLQYCSRAGKGDIIALEDLNEILGFRGVKETSTNSRLNILFYKA